MGRQDKNQYRSLESLRQSGSTSRLLNLCAIYERHAGNPDYIQKPMFNALRLNRALIVKHTLRAQERADLRTTRAAATKVILPYSPTELKLGGSSIFIEHELMERALSETLGLRQDDPGFVEDMERLRVLSQLPSLDPFLLRERLSGAGREVGRCYFDLSDADAQEMKSYVAAEIHRLVVLAFLNRGASAEAMSRRLAEKLLQDDMAEALEPLRKTLNLSVEDYAEGIFAWKGFLYYKWTLAQVAPKLRPVAEEILGTHILRVEHDEKLVINGLRRKIIDGIGHYAYLTKRALARYDKAFAGLVERGDAAGFRDFLLNAPATFLMIGDVLGVLTHIVSFWRYRFFNLSHRALTAEEAMDLFADFESSLTPRDAEEIAA